MVETLKRAFPSLSVFATQPFFRSRVVLTHFPGGSPRRVRAPDLFGDESVGNVVERVRVRTGAAVPALVERGDRADVGGLEFEVK